MKKTAFLLGVSFLLAIGAWAADPIPLKPTPKDKCPVCGMFVYKYPDWVSQTVFRDGSRIYFDGVKDLMKGYFSISRVQPGKSRGEITGLYVTDYYSLEIIEGTRAFFVIGSDVFGPMGKELIPFAKEPEAREFLKDHKGKKILRFQEITPEILKTLD
jgi:nitrous oxide reductase accessory protein NosL